MKGTLIGGGGLLLVPGLVLFVACANVAQLRLALAETHRKELGVRMALGAGSWRVARQLLVEISLVSLAGAGSGVLLAQFLMQTVSEFITAVVPIMDYGIRLDYRVLTFAVASAVCAVLFSGFAPTRHAVKVEVIDVLKSDPGRRGLWWSARSLASPSKSSPTLVSDGFFDRRSITTEPVSPFWEQNVLDG